MNADKLIEDVRTAALKWPQDAVKIASLSISGFQMWYASQPAKDMVFLGQNKEFKRFVFWSYTWKVKLLRLYYRIKQFYA